MMGESCLNRFSTRFTLRPRLVVFVEIRVLFYKFKLKYTCTINNGKG